MAFSPMELRKAFGAFITGITVVTTSDAKGNPFGFTANSFSSVSMEPPLLLVSISNFSENLDVYTRNVDHFAINILNNDQEDLSRRFAAEMPCRFTSVDWSMSKLNNPILTQHAAFFDCRLHQTVDAGDHTILIGEIDNFSASDKPGLGYYRGRYFTPPHHD